VEPSTLQLHSALCSSGSSWLNPAVHVSLQFAQFSFCSKHVKPGSLQHLLSMQLSPALAHIKYPFSPMTSQLHGV